MDFFYKCQMTQEGICIRVLFFTKTIPFDEITSIQKVPLGKALIEGINPLRPPMITTGDLSLYVVLIETIKKRLIVLSAKDSDEFVRIVSSQLTVSS